MSRCLWVSCYFVELRSEAPSEQSVSPSRPLWLLTCVLLPWLTAVPIIVRDHSCVFFSHSQTV